MTEGSPDPRDATDRPPARNRVTPRGDLVAVAARGAWMGNRGLLHTGSGARDVVRTHRNRAWLMCTLEFKGRRLPQWQPGRYTQLFFLDEAVALAAGHRPCAECRRPEYNAFRAAWARGRGVAVPSARDLDEVLHGERVLTSPGPRPTAAWSGLPDGVFVVGPAGPLLVVGEHVVDWDERAYAYGTHGERPRTGRVALITPPASVAALCGGYVVQIDGTARRAA